MTAGEGGALNLPGGALRCGLGLRRQSALELLEVLAATGAGVLGVLEPLLLEPFSEPDDPEPDDPEPDDPDPDDPESDDPEPDDPVPDDPVPDGPASVDVPGVVDEEEELPLRLSVL